MPIAWQAWVIAASSCSTCLRWSSITLPIEVPADSDESPIMSGSPTGSVLPIQRSEGCAGPRPEAPLLLGDRRLEPSRRVVALLDELQDERAGDELPQHLLVPAGSGSTRARTLRAYASLRESSALSSGAAGAYVGSPGAWSAWDWSGSAWEALSASSAYETFAASTGAGWRCREARCSARTVAALPAPICSASTACCGVGAVGRARPRASVRERGAGRVELAAHATPRPTVVRRSACTVERGRAADHEPPAVDGHERPTAGRGKPRLRGEDDGVAVAGEVDRQVRTGDRRVQLGRRGHEQHRPAPDERRQAVAGDTSTSASGSSATPGPRRKASTPCSSPRS